MVPLFYRVNDDHDSFFRTLLKRKVIKNPTAFSSASWETLEMDGQKENLATLDDSSPWIFFLVVSRRRKKISLRWYNQWNKTEESSSGENSFAQFTPGQTLCLGNDDACCLLFGWSKTLSWTLTLLSSLRCNRREEKKNLQLNYHHFVTICFCACKEPRRLPVIWLPKKIC